MQIINNHAEFKHSHKLLSLFENADEVFIATAFLKVSGLKAIFPSIKTLVEKGKAITVVAGQHFALTEPKALHSLRELFLNSGNSALFLAKAEKTNEVFHPKLFLFRKGNDTTIIIGSANITDGGLTKNTECSMCIARQIQDPLWLQARTFFDYITSTAVSEPATLLSIKRYETFYDKQKHYYKKVKAIPDRNKEQREFNYDNLLYFFKSYDKQYKNNEFIKRRDDYTEAKTILDLIASDSSLTSKSFKPLLEKLVGKEGEKRLWHSGSLFRQKTTVLEDFKDFIKLVKYIKGNCYSSPAIVFDNAKEIVRNIYGAGTNYVTEIMMTYNPNLYANLNNNPIKVLRTAGDVKMKATPSSYNGDDYEEFCELVKEISSKLGLKNLLEADSFFNDIYWKIYKK